jgi:hypothetical protein
MLSPTCHTYVHSSSCFPSLLRDYFPHLLTNHFSWDTCPNLSAFHFIFFSTLIPLPLGISEHSHRLSWDEQWWSVVEKNVTCGPQMGRCDLFTQSDLPWYSFTAHLQLFSDSITTPNTPLSMTVSLMFFSFFFALPRPSLYSLSKTSLMHLLVPAPAPRLYSILIFNSFPDQNHRVVISSLRTYPCVVARSVILRLSQSIPVSPPILSRTLRSETTWLFNLTPPHRP